MTSNYRLYSNEQFVSMITYLNNAISQQEEDNFRYISSLRIFGDDVETRKDNTDE